MDDNLIEGSENLDAMTENNGLPTVVQNIGKINIDEEMKASYIDYAMAVIVGRAFTDVRDGQSRCTRILYAI